MLARQIVWMMAGAIVLTILMVTSTVLWTARQNNIRAADDSQRMISGGLLGMKDRLSTLNWDYSAWTIALENALARDADWLTDNMGSGADGTTFDVMQITWPEDGSHFVWSVDTDGEIATDAFIPEELTLAVHAELQNVELGDQDTITIGARIDERTYLISASRIHAWDRENPLPAAQLPVNFMAIELSPEMLASVGDIYLVDDLSLLPSVDSSKLAVPLNGLFGEPVAFFTWTPPTPGDALIRSAAIPLGVAMSLFLVLSGTVTVLARRGAKELVRREGEAKIIARTDVLTGLPNRLAVNERLIELRQQGGEIVLLFLDVNSFKLVNDEHGHAVGDDFIIEIANAANDCKRDEDFLARIGGDEFNLLFTSTDAIEACETFCRKLNARMDASVAVHGISFKPIIAKGYVVGDIGETSVSELMRRADVAMYEAKNCKLRDGLKYDPSIEADAKRNAEILGALKTAAHTGGEFEVVYQPIFDARTGEMRLAEALLRWHSKTLGNIPPTRFIPIAERSGLIVKIGYWVLERVFSDLSLHPSLCVSVNISPVQLRSNSLLTEISQLAELYGVDPARITFELTEGMLIEEPEAASFTLDALRDQGYKIAIDDFGTGYSSIGYLQKFKLDKLKIDKSFVDDLGIKENSESLMTALAYLSRSLELEIVAEGVETERQLELLKELDYDLLQGYLLSRPISLDELVRGPGNMHSEPPTSVAQGLG